MPYGFNEDKSIFDLDSLIGSIATIETSPATVNHAKGEYIVYESQLYKVTAAIASGEALVVGTNIEATTTGDELESLNNGLMKVFYGSSFFGEVAGNVDSEVGVHQLPSDLNEIMAIIPFGYVPNKTWATTLVFTGIRLNGRQSRIDIRVNGTTAQTYSVKYILLYR